MSHWMCARPKSSLGEFAVCHKPEGHSGECVYKSDAIVLLMAKVEEVQKHCIERDKRIAELEKSVAMIDNQQGRIY